jgi:hypothetical protein
VRNRNGLWNITILSALEFDKLVLLNFAISRRTTKQSCESSLQNKVMDHYPGRSISCIQSTTNNSSTKCIQFPNLKLQLQPSLLLQIHPNPHRHIQPPSILKTIIMSVNKILFEQIPFQLYVPMKDE